MIPTTVNQRWQVNLPKFLHEWDAWASWERERFESMHEHLSSSDVLFDIGTEQGALSAIYAQWCQMVLFEPHPDAWPTIRAIWEANDLPSPRGCFAGLVGTSTNLLPEALDFDPSIRDVWPACAYSGAEQQARAYRYIHEHAHSTPQTTLDDWSNATGIKPSAITIDVEGAEYDVLLGSVQVLARDRPKVWVSVHPDLMGRDYSRTPEDVHGLMKAANYSATHLGTDHEEHWFYSPL